MALKPYGRACIFPFKEDKVSTESYVHCWRAMDVVSGLDVTEKFDFRYLC